MAEGPTSAPREQRWWPVVTAVAALFVLPAVPPLRVLLPIEQMTLLLIPAIAACFLVGWWAGGRPWLALIWVGLTILVFWVLPGPNGSAYRDLARAWALIVGGSFGLTAVSGGGRPFLPRGLSAVGLAILLALVLSVIGELPPQRAEGVFAAQFALRNAQSAAQLQESARLVPQFEGVTEWGIRLMAAMADAAIVVFPALLALQGLAVCAVAWALYHRLSRVRLGPPLGRLRDLSFGDQLVWGLVAGAALAVLPAMSPLQGLGLNLLVFFGALYALRGLGVAIWFLSGRSRPLTVAAVAAALLAWPVAPVAALGLGVSDTWFDWRGRHRDGRAASGAGPSR